MQSQTALRIMLDQITPLIITYDEAPNIERVVGKLAWARRIVVVDSGSTDKTLEILHSYPQVDVIYRPFDEFASQCNFGLSQTSTDWVLSLDADYVLSDDLVDELKNLKSVNSIVGYRARFVYRIHGRALRGSLYPPRTVLYRRHKASYQNEGHGHRVVIDGKVTDFKGIIFHDDRKPLARWISAQRRYARDEANYLLGGPREKFSKTDKIRAMGWPAPVLVLLYTLFAKGCILDGWPGWHYALQRLLAEALITLEIVDQRLRQKSNCGAE